MCACECGGFTVHARQVDSSFDISVHEVEVLGHLLEYEQVTGKEQLAVEDGRRRIFGLECLGRADQGLSAIPDRFLGQVVKDGGLLHA